MLEEVFHFFQRCCLRLLAIVLLFHQGPLEQVLFVRLGHNQMEL